MARGEGAKDQVGRENGPPCWVPAPNFPSPRSPRARTEAKSLGRKKSGVFVASGGPLALRGPGTRGRAALGMQPRCLSPGCAR